MCAAQMWEPEFEPQYPHTFSAQKHVYAPKLEVETKGSSTLLASQASLIHKLQVREETLSQNKVKSNSSISNFQVCMQTLTCT